MYGKAAAFRKLTSPAANFGCRIYGTSYVGPSIAFRWQIVADKRQFARGGPSGK